MKNFLPLDFLQHRLSPYIIVLVKISDTLITQYLRKKLQLKLKDNITLLPLTPQAAIFGFFEADCQTYLIQNYILLISKL